LRRAMPPVAPEEIGALLGAVRSLTLVVLAAASLLGAAYGARQVVEGAFAGERAPSGTTYRRMADSPLARRWFAEGTHWIGTGTARVPSVADALDAVDVDTPLPVAERARLRMQLVTAAVECRQAVEKLLDPHSASGFAESNPLRRFWRYIGFGSRQPQLISYITEEDDGRVLLGAEHPVLQWL
jgi:Acyl-CoA dehydrogenase, C-terminal domain